MKTPEEIKKGLECCIAQRDGRCEEYVACVCCPYFSENPSAEDALAYIQQLEEREWELFDLLSSAWFTKACYFHQKDGTVYSRVSGEYMTFDQAIDEFAHVLTEETQLEAAHRTEYCEEADYDCKALGKARKRIAELEAQVPKWISVEERLPEVSDVVLVIANGKPREHITLHNAFLIASYWGEEGCWGMLEALICLDILDEILKLPFWKRKKKWREYEHDVVAQIVEPTNAKIRELMEARV